MTDGTITIKVLMRAKLHGGVVASCSVNEKTASGGRAFVYQIGDVEVNREMFLAVLKLSEAASMAMMAGEDRTMTA